MQRKGLTILIFLVFLISSYGVSGQSKKYVFYLHGRIVEIQGAKAYSKQFGNYEYSKIVEALTEKNITVLSEVRSRDTKVIPYAKKIISQIDSLHNQGVSSKDITIVGTSKGSMIAMQVSSILKDKQLNFVFIAGAFKSLIANSKLELFGNILAFYEKSDSIAGRSYQPLINRSKGVIKFKEIELNTNLGHGIVFKPLNEWIFPTLNWIHK